MKTPPDFPSHLPPIQAKSPAWQWVYRGRKYRTDHEIPAGHLAYITDNCGEWAINGHAEKAEGGSFHYAELVPLESPAKPDYASREYQLSVISAALDGAEFEVRVDSKWLTHKNPYAAFDAVFKGYKLRIKPQPDPYADLKAAYKSGKHIEVLDDMTKAWVRILEPNWDAPVESYRVKPETVPLEAGDWLNGPWYICTEPTAPNRILDMVITFSDVSITISTHGCEPKLCSIHCSDYGTIFRTRDGVNFEPCSKEAK